MNIPESGADWNTSRKIFAYVNNATMLQLGYVCCTFFIVLGFLGMNFNTKGGLETTREAISIKINSMYMYITNASRDVLTYSRPAHIFD